MRNLIACALLVLCGTSLAEDSVTRAEALFDRQCKSCHLLQPPPDSHEVLIGDGPPLVHAGTKFRHDWLVAWLEHPTRIRPAGYLSFRYTVAAADGDHVDTGRLPQHPSLSHEDARLIADWFGLQRHELAVTPAEATAAVRGDLHFQKILGCSGCHQIANQGGLSGPELGTAPARLDVSWLRAFVQDTSAWSPTLMPKFTLQPAQVDAVLEFVERDREPAPPAAPVPRAAAQSVPRDHPSMPRPALLYLLYCSQCHGIRGNGKGINAPYLFVAPRDHTSIEEMGPLTQEDVFTAIKFGGRAVGKSSTMPSWSGTIPDEDIRLLATYVKALSRGQENAAR